MATAHKDHRHEDHGQGTVKDPAHDGRLKQNRDSGTSMGTTDKSDVEAGHQGRVKHPETDHRLKENR